MIRNLSLAILLGLLTQASARAETGESFSDHLLTRILSADQGLQSVQLDTESELKRIFLGFSATGSFGIPGVVDIELSPEITLIWERSDF